MKLFTLLLLLVSGQLFAQGGTMVGAKPGQITFSGLAVPSTNSYFGVKGEAGKLLGDTYLDTAFQAGNVRFYGNVAGASDSLAGIPIRLDLRNHELDMLTADKTVKAAPAAQVRAFAVNNRQAGVSRFVNVREYGAAGLTGFFEVVVTGPLTLLHYHSVTLQRANYNPALNTGSRDDELLKRADWYVARGRDVQKVTPGRKTLLALMADRKPQIDAYLKEHRPDLKSKDDLSALFRYYNTLGTN